MNAASLLLITALTIATPSLVLVSGKRIAVDEPVRIDNSIILFRSGGTLFSIPAEEVDLEATRAAGASITVTSADEPAKLKVTAAERQRLLRDLEQNHTGTTATTAQLDIPASAKRSPSAGTKQDEWQWKNMARQYEEQVRRAKEELELLQNRAAEMRAQISGFLSLGYKPAQFTYQTTQLAYLEEQMPRAEMEVRRAERAYLQFLDDARRQGVLPGWLR